MTRAHVKSRILAVVLLAGVAPWLVGLAAQLLFGDMQFVQEPLHEFFELTGMCIALGVAMLLLLRVRHQQTAPHLMWVIAALVAMGLADGVHGVAPFGLAWSWLRHGATFVGGAIFALVWLPPPAVARRRERAFVLIVAALALAGSLAVWRWAEWLPTPFSSGGYSFPVKATNAAGGLGFLAAAVFFLRRYLHLSRSEDLVFASHTLLFGTASLLFGLSHVWDASWWVWHTNRLLAYTILLIAAYEIVVALYQRTARHAQELNQSNRVLQEEAAQRALAESALQAERKRLFDVLETIPAMVCLLTPDYHVAFANHSFRARFGESNGRRCYEYCFGRAQPCEFCETYRVLATGKPHRWEVIGREGSVIEAHDFPFTDVDGSPLILEMDIDITEFRRTQAALKEANETLEQRVTERTAELQVAITSLNESRRAALNVMEDAIAARRRAEEVSAELRQEIAERKRAEETLRRTAAELRRSNQDLEQFAYIASHDLQEPLRQVSSFVGLLRRRYTGRLDARADEYIGYAVEGSKRMSQLVRDLLAYSRIGTRSKDYGPIDSNQALETVLETLQFAIADHCAVVTHEPLPTIRANAEELMRLFQNLIDNALKFRGAEPPRIHVSARPADGMWEFAVRDNGIGMDPAHCERIFQVFERLHGNEAYPGTGIGLAICKKIVELHGGRISAESEPGKGSTFRFTLETVSPPPSPPARS